MDSVSRQSVVFIISIFVLCGAVVAVLATIQQRDYILRGYVDATATSDLPFRIPLLGVNAELSQYSPDELRQNLDLMEQAHITWVRQIFPWNEIEPIDGNYNWEPWDEIVNTVDEFSQLQLVAVLVNSPEWARTDSVNATITAPPVDPQMFAEFAEEFAERYGSIIDYYQVWDEPNIELGWGGLEPRPADYLALLQASFQAIHSSDESATVITAGFAPTVEMGPRNIGDISYLDDLYRLGGASYSDAIAAKPYGFASSPDDRTVSNSTLNFSRIVALHEVMERYGDNRKHLWASSWGWNSLPSDWSGAESIWGATTSDEQVAFTLNALDRAQREWTWLGGMILHQWQPDTAYDDPQWGFSLLDQDGQPKALLTALLNRRENNVARDGLYHPLNPFTRYEGIWTFSEFGADIGWVQDSGFTFTFTGAEVALLVRKDDYVAYFYPTIDGKQANALPHDTDGNAYLALRSGDLRLAVDLITVASDLSLDQVHSLRVVADELIPDEIINRWSLAGIAVSSGDISRPFNRQIIIGLIAVGIASVAVAMSGWAVKWRIAGNIFKRFWIVVGDVGQIIVTFTTSLALLVGMFLTWNDGLPVIFRRDSVQIALSLATAGVIYINKFGIVVTLVAGTLLFVFSYNKIELGTMLTLFWAPFFLFPVELYRFAFPIAEIILYITTGAFVLRSLVNYAHSRQSTVNLQSRQTLSTTDWLMLAYVMIGLISLSWAENRATAFTDWRSLFFQPTLFYFILRRTINDSRQLSCHVFSLLFAGFVVSIVGIAMWINGSAVITAEGGARRLASVYGSPNNVALLLERCIPFLIASLLLGMKKLRILTLVLLAGVVPAVLLTQSAGALMLAIPLSVVFVMALSWRKRAIAPIVGLCAIVAIGFIIASQTARFERVFDFSSGTSFYRFRVWESALNLIHDHPITGVGLDQFLPAFRERYILPDAWEEPDLSHPHNFVLDFWTRLGVFGVAIFGGLQFAFWKTAYQRYRFERNKQNPMMHMLMVGAMGSMVALLVHGLVDNSIFVLDLAYIFVFLLCVAEFKQNISAID